MQENKVLVKVIMPEVDQEYDVLLPINKKIGNIIELLSKSISEINIGDTTNKSKCLYNKNTGVRYNFDSIVYETDIRNNSVLIFL